MSERLGPHDLAMWAGESVDTPSHNATIEIFDPGDSGFSYQSLVTLIAERIAFVPRYRQRIVAVPGGLANPVWIDDTRFDLAYHVRRSALPRPGSSEQLRELVARIVSRPLDRNRPLWEVYFVEGLADGRVAVLSKSHQVLVDGVHTVDLGQVLLDVTPERKHLEYDEWRPEREPSAAGLVAAAVTDTVEHPLVAIDTLRGRVDALGRAAVGVGSLAGGIFGAMTQRRPEAPTPINKPLSQQRRFVPVRTELADYRTVRRVHGGTVNDVVLATVTGALRGWLMTREESMGGLRRLRAIVPMSVIDDDLEPTSLGTQVTGCHVELPIGEPSPLVRLHQVGYSFDAHARTGRAVAANRLAGIAGFAPTTFHALGSRVAAREIERHDFHLAVTNVPGPQFPLYAAGARMMETYPVPPLVDGHALAIGVTSYDGGVYYGITADRDALPDVDVLGQCLVEALDELVESATDTRRRAPRGRTPSTGRAGRGTARTKQTGKAPRSTQEPAARKTVRTPARPEEEK